jgi:hypothetical protein
VNISLTHRPLEYTLVLTKGVYVVSWAAIDKIQHAIWEGAKLVTIELDFFGNADSGRQTTIATAHVIAWTENPAKVRSDLSNVTSLPRAPRR